MKNSKVLIILFIVIICALGMGMVMKKSMIDGNRSELNKFSGITKQFLKPKAEETKLLVGIF